MGDHWSGVRYTLSEVVARTGAKRRAVQLWSDGDVIRSTRDTDRAGTGVHRLYHEWEVLIAALLVPLANIGVPIGHLKQFAALMRPMVQNAKAVQPDRRGITDDSRKIMNAIARATNGEGENYLCFAWGPDYQWISVKTDEDSPICINLPADFPIDLKRRKATPRAFVVLDLTTILHSALK
jgi:DNA-binding transcriptional MerR regulator